MTKIPIRWMIRRDMPEVLAIEQDSFDYPWFEEEFLRVLRQRNCIGMVAEHGERIVGFMIYELHLNKISVLDFGVHRDFRRRRIGCAMISKLIAKLSPQRRSTLEFVVRETQLPAHLFLRQCDLRATQVMRGHYPDSGEDAYRFSFRLAGAEPEFMGSVSQLTEGWA